MKKTFTLSGIFWIALMIIVLGCDSSQLTGNNGEDKDDNGEKDGRIDSLTYYSTDQFVMGADLSYVNQIEDHGGAYKDGVGTTDPYRIFWKYGANVVRLRLWHDPQWVRTEVYGDSSKTLYGGLPDVTRSIRRAREQNMEVLLDFHFSDFWADPGTQRVPEAWREISTMEVLRDSVYQYTRRTLLHLEDRGLLPEMVQIGNETNCGMVFSEAPPEFPELNVCENENWQELGSVIKQGIKAVREVAGNSEVKTKIILHIAQPENVEWWFDHIRDSGGVTDFDIVGFSYYSPWSDVPIDELSDHVSNFRNSYDKEVMIMETAYPWTMDYADDYNNIFGQNSLEDGYPASTSGQLNYMRDLVREVIDGGGRGVFYWEPAWITSGMKTMWGTGSAWENNAFFDFEGKLHDGMDYMTSEYAFE